MARFFSMSLPAWSPSLGLGLGMVFVVGLFSWWLAQYVPSLGNVTLAILFGVLVGNLLTAPRLHRAVDEGSLFAEKQLLPLSIACLGVELLLGNLIALGALAVVVIVVSIGISLVVSVKLGEWLGFSRKFSVLMGAGNAICGSSAVASMSLAIHADEADTGISIGVVNLLGTVGIFLLPSLVGWLGLSALQSGLLIGGTLQAFGQTLAAGFSVGASVGQIATVVKMGRVLMLAPVVVWVGSRLRARQVQRGEVVKGSIFPRFIVGFFVMSVLASFQILPASVLSAIATVGKFALVLAMVGIGMRIQFRTLFRSGLSALLFGALVWLVQMVAVLVVIALLA